MQTTRAGAITWPAFFLRPRIRVLGRKMEAIIYAYVAAGVTGPREKLVESET